MINQDQFSLLDIAKKKGQDKNPAPSLNPISYEKPRQRKCPEHKKLMTAISNFDDSN